MSGRGKVALVTGAGSGIGRATALALMAEGYAMVLVGRRQEQLDATAELGKATGSRSLAVPTDVGDPAAVKALFAKVKEEFGRLDLLFNNAGTGTPRFRSRSSPTSSGRPWSTSTSPGPSCVPRRRCG